MEFCEKMKEGLERRALDRALEKDLMDYVSDVLKEYVWVLKNLDDRLTKLEEEKQ